LVLRARTTVKVIVRLLALPAASVAVIEKR
jgi:hypothetical protein